MCNAISGRDIIETAKNSIETFDKILKLREEVNKKLSSLGRRANKGQALVNYLYQMPIVDAQKTSKVTGLSLASAYKLLDDLERLKIIYEMTGGKRGKMYAFKDYLNLFN